MRTLAAVLSALCFWLVTTRASAHVANLSQSDFTVDGPTVHAIIVFSKPDAARLGKLHPNASGAVTPEALDASQAVFRALVGHDIAVSADGQACAPSLEGGGDVEEDGFGLSVVFACAKPPQDLQVSMNLLLQLPPGHRHIIRVRSGDVSREAVLTSTNPRVDIKLSAAASGATSLRAGSVLANAIRLGIEHILTGWDHLLFLFALLLGTRGLRRIVLAISAFTVAHSITLALAALGLVAPSPRFIEPAIAASIAYVALENVWHPGAPHRWRLTFVFGLIHGFGFARALRELALPRERLLPTLLGFNLGVETGQLLIVMAIVPVLTWAFQHRANASTLVRATSIVIAIIGMAVFVLRIALPS